MTTASEIFISASQVQEGAQAVNTSTAGPTEDGGQTRPEHQPLGRGRRTGAALIDYAIVAPLATLTLLITQGLLPLMGITWLLEAFENGEMKAYSGVMAGSFIYHAATIHRLGGTLGHLAVGGRVAHHHQTGERLSLPRSILRAALSVMDLLYVPTMINAAMVLARRDGRHLYDLTAGTAVVRREKKRAEAGSIRPRQATSSRRGE